MWHAARRNTGRKNSPKNSPSAHHHTICRAICSQLGHVSTIGKTFRQLYFLHLVNFGQLAAETGWWVWSTPANFNGFRVLASLLHQRRSTEVNQALREVWTSPGLVHYTMSQKMSHLRIAITLTYINGF